VLGFREPFMHALAPDVADILGETRHPCRGHRHPALTPPPAGDAYPDICARASVAAAVMAAEEEAFQRTLAQVRRRLESRLVARVETALWFRFESSAGLEACC
jgi:hypothetical protein